MNAAVPASAPEPTPADLRRLAAPAEQLTADIRDDARAAPLAYAAAEPGLSWPPADPAESWAGIVGLLVAALDDIRDELGRLTTRGQPLTA